jgi:hypothetical protein
MSESFSSNRMPWLRWGLLALVLLVGVILLLILAPGSAPIVSVEGAPRS